jgi:aspartyl-tRNA(Asn)/glutamyl-tRNA(Gln) amidotransferase subunit B
VAEIARQTAVLAGGGRVEQATLLYDADHDKLAVMRSKEFAHDYRYFPEPDLPVLVVGDEWRAGAKARLPELPWTREERLVADYALPPYDAAVLTEERDLSDYFEALARMVPPKTASNWVMTEVLRHMKDNGWDVAAWRTRVPVAGLALLLQKIESGTLTGTLAKQALATALAEGAPIDTVLARPEFQVRSSSDDLLPLVRAVVTENPGPVSQYRAGKTATIGFLVGQVMKMSNGQAVPQTVKQLLETELARQD